MELDVNAQVSQPATLSVTITSPSATPPWQSFVSWLNKFGEAYPLWAKEGMALHPVRTLTECQKFAFGVEASRVVEKIKGRFETAVKPVQSN